jgi:hypothetical protein
MGRKAQNVETQRGNFINGRVKELKVGGYGGTVHLRAEAESDGPGKVMLAMRTPKVQRTVRPNTRETREAAVAAADELLRQRGNGRRPAGARVLLRPVAPGATAAWREDGTPLTVTDAFLLYLKNKKSFPATSLTWTEKDVLQHLRTLPKAARAKRPGAAFLISLLQAYRRIGAVGAIPLDRDIGEIQPGELESHVDHAFAAGHSASTVETDLGRLRTVLTHVRTRWPRIWGRRANPVEGLPKLERKTPIELGEACARAAIAELARHPGRWRAHAAAVLVYELGARVGSVGANQRDRQDLAPALSANDFFLDDDGRFKLRWRKETLKDPRMAAVIPVSTTVRALVERLVAEHPNPLGPGYPLLWSPEHPRVSVSYAALAKPFKKALAMVWPRFYPKTEFPKGVSFHSLVYTTVTTIANARDITAAADLTLRTEATIRKFYKKDRQEHLGGLVDSLESARERMAAEAEANQIGETGADAPAGVDLESEGGAK